MGLFYLADGKSEQFQRRGVAWALQFSQAVSAAITKSRQNQRLVTLVRSLESTRADLHRTHSLTLRVLVRALDYKDDETKGHSTRVVEYAVRLGQQLELTEVEISDLRWGALLHDIGKIGIPDNVLKKPGPLDDEEWKVMRRHPLLGFDLIKDIEFLRPALPVVLHHHERFDGTGYPDGLKGGDIPLTARIFSLVDALDAITSVRPYKQARPVAAAFTEIERGRGTQFCPACVGALLKIPKDDFRTIRDRSLQRDPVERLVKSLTTQKSSFLVS